MARARKADEPEFIINAREPGLGVGILVKKDAERRTYRFVGEERSFKEAYCQLYIKEALHVAPEIKAKLKPAKVETGIQVQVPSYIESGDRIRVDTRDGRFIERAK